MQVVRNTPSFILLPIHLPSIHHYSSIHLSIHPHFIIYPAISYPANHPATHLSTQPATHPFIHCLSIHILSIYLPSIYPPISTHLPIHFNIHHPPTHPSIHPSINHPSICSPTIHNPPTHLPVLLSGSSTHLPIHPHPFIHHSSMYPLFTPISQTSTPPPCYEGVALGTSHEQAFSRPGAFQLRTSGEKQGEQQPEGSLSSRTGGVTHRGWNPCPLFSSLPVGSARVPSRMSPSPRAPAVPSAVASASGAVGCLLSL